MRLAYTVAAAGLVLAIGGIFSQQREPAFTYLPISTGLPEGELSFRKQCLALRRGMRIKEHGDSRLWQKGTGMASRLRRLTGAASGWERRAITLFLNKGAVVDVKIYDFAPG